LTGGNRPGPARHRSLQETISWSYGLLSEPEQRLLARLAVFAGSFTIEAAEAICADAALVPASRVLELLFQLADKSLLVVDEHEGEVRYRLLETIRQFARELLERNDERNDLRRTFRDWYRALVERAEPELLGPGNVPWMRRIWAEIDNLRSVLETGRRDDSLEDVLRVATALWPFWVQSTLLSEGRGWLEQLLTSPDIEHTSQHVLARATLAVAVISQRQGDFAQSMVWTEEALRHSASLGDERVTAFAYNNLCTCALMRNDYERTVAVCSESLARSQALNFGVGVVASLASLGEAELIQGNLAGCRPLLQQSLALAREMHFAPFICWMLVSLGEAARHEGDHAAARAQLLESLEIARSIREGFGIGRALRGLGRLALANGDIQEASRLLV
jgi:tetratricopeptide (TPR) repeat protein